MSANDRFAEYIREFSEEPINRRRISIENNQLLNSPSKRIKTQSIDYGIKKPRPSDDLRKQLIKLEHTETGEVKASVYINYFRSLTYFWLTMVLAGYIGIQLASIGSNVWLAIWSNDNLIDNSDKSDSFNLTGSDQNSTTSTNITQKDIFQRNSRLAVFGCFGLFQGEWLLLLFKIEFC